MSTLGSRIAESRKAQGLSQAELATHVGKTPKAISFYELDQRIPSLQIIVKIANVLGVSAAWLAGFADAHHDPR